MSRILLFGKKLLKEIILKKFKKIRFISLIVVFVFITAATRDNIYKQIKDSQRTFNSVYKYLVAHYVEDLDIEKFTKMSIDNMLADLDPYTVYLEDEQRNNIELITKGEYGGVGIQIGKRDDYLTVISPMPDSPAEKAGIIGGDIILFIDSTSTKGLSMDGAAKLIRGTKGSEVNLTIQRFGEDSNFIFTLIRGDIKIKDITYSGIFDNRIGYIKLTKFSKNSAIELEKSLNGLIESGMESLILDLRDNPGGLLKSAISILDLFIDPNNLLVWTEGKARQSNKKYFSKTTPVVPSNFPIVVLINGGSASASEIVAGTLQDLDKAVIVGNQSFGKGLVQTVYNIDRRRSLKITTAKYYIPSGRLIQKDGYLPEDLLLNKSNEDSLFETVGGRSVLGGGGITPDYIVKRDKVGPLLAECWRKGLFFSFVKKHKNLFESYLDVESDMTVLNQFKDYIYDKDLDVVLKGENSYLDARETLLKNDSLDISVSGAIDLLDRYFEEKALTQFDLEREQINDRLMIEFAQSFGGNEGKVRASTEVDNDFLRAIEILQDPFVYKSIFNIN